MAYPVIRVNAAYPRAQYVLSSLPKRDQHTPTLKQVTEVERGETAEF